MGPSNAYWGIVKTLEMKEASKSEIVVREPDILKSEQNRLYFYSDIGRENVLKLNHKLRDMANTFIVEQICRNVDKPVPIYLHINSYGGSIFHGLSAMDSVLSCPVPVYTIVDGCCASAATFISVAGAKRFMQPNAYMLIHQLSSMMWGKFAEFKDEMENLDMLMTKIKAIYKKYTKVPSEKLDELLKHDLWWDAETCVKYGLVDEITNGGER